MNTSSDNIAEHYNTQYVIEEISKIPSIFGRKNDLSRKIDKSDVIRRSIKGEDIEILVTPQYNDLNDSYVKKSQNSRLKVHPISRTKSPDRNRNLTE